MSCIFSCFCCPRNVTEVERIPPAVPHNSPQLPQNVNLHSPPLQTEKTKEVSELARANMQHNIPPLPIPGSIEYQLIHDPLVLSPTSFQIITQMRNSPVNGRISFFDNPYDIISECLGMFYRCDITLSLNGKNYTFPSAEAAFIAMQFFPHKMDLIQECTISTNKAMYIGTVNKGHIREDWDKVKLIVLKDVVYKKFIQNPGFKCVLLGTMGFDFDRSSFYNDDGRDQLPKILKGIREDFINATNAASAAADSAYAAVESAASAAESAASADSAASASAAAENAASAAVAESAAAAVVAAERASAAIERASAADRAAFAADSTKANNAAAAAADSAYAAADSAAAAERAASAARAAADSAD